MTIKYKYNILPILETFDPIRYAQEIMAMERVLKIEFYELQRYIHSRKSDKDYVFTPYQLEEISTVLDCNIEDLLKTK